MDFGAMNSTDARARAEELVSEVIVAALEKKGIVGMRDKLDRINVKIEILFGLEESPKAPIQDKLLDVKGLVDYLGVGKNAIYKLVNEQRIPFYRIGGRVRFDLAKVKKWLEKAECRGRLTRRIPVDDSMIAQIRPKI